MLQHGKSNIQAPVRHNACDVKCLFEKALAVGTVHALHANTGDSDRQIFTVYAQCKKKQRALQWPSHKCGKCVCLFCCKLCYVLEPENPGENHFCIYILSNLASFPFSC